ncbi:hypothetical protein NL108_001280 [Boleophthalmus pectinirostris]|uniref:IGF-like family receptor 1 n=1 Tax=Boleophthalmus pectinirostris TaxID=150288 RepID=UPI0024311DF1|nr:IGF-like family receptor 1 [Boleophthalmus pectinirostris]KAJ0066053.1 hypothetical protein NL108_001280 [Boleophthalmus pectinirostris]
MGHSVKCPDRTTYFKNGKCVPCEKPGPGREITPNCGFDDHQGRHEATSRKCPHRSFNDGTNYYCKPCSSCVQGFTIVEPCSVQVDTKCQGATKTTNMTYTQTTTASYEVVQNNPVVPQIPETPWVVPLTLFICCVALALSCWFIFRKRGFKKTFKQSTSLFATQETNEPKDILSPEILAAPLKCVLNDLDVLEELIMLLDPETKGIKNTKHLASLCRFSSNWVTYTYSLKDTKSPLNALLEGVTCQHPDWTVEHLVLLLQQIERVDAVVALGKLSTSKLQVIDV